ARTPARPACPARHDPRVRRRRRDARGRRPGVHPRRAGAQARVRGRRPLARALRRGVRQRHRRDPARAAGARRGARRRGDHHAVHLLRHRGHDPQRGRHRGVRRHRPRHVPHRPGRGRRGPHRALEGRGPGRPVRPDGAARARGRRRARAADHRGRGAVHRRAPADRRGVAHGRRGGDDRHVQLLPVEEPGRVRRRRDDRHAGRGAQRPAHAAADARQREDVLPRGGGLQQPPRRAAGRGAAREAAAPRGLERRPPPQRALLRRRVRGPGRRAHADDRPGQRVDLQPVHAPRRAARRPPGAPQGAGRRQRHLLPAPAAPPAVLRVPRLPSRVVPRGRAGRRGGAVAAGLPRAHHRAARRGRRRRPLVLRPV
ncbi:MAG: Aminotransferase, DegT/DnrJ/EryC1/StrS family, partial [uncultured Gemmatimonadaceae bacterium]